MCYGGYSSSYVGRKKEPAALSQTLGGCMAYHKIFCLVLVFSWIFFAVHPSLGVTPYDDVMVQEALKNLQEENYEEAVAGLTEAWQKGTHTPEKAFLLGQSYRSLLNYSKAKEYLDEALRLKPNFPPAQFLLADTLIALEQPKEAMPILQQLEASGYQPGQVAFLMGMVAAKDGKHSEALGYFRKAESDPKVAQEARFQASLALASLNRLKEAQKELEQTVSINPQTQTADFAQRYLSVLEQRLKEQRPFHIAVSAGFDYDSNVTSQPGDPAAAAQVSGRGDVTFTQIAALDYNINPSGPFSVLAQYAYFQNFHRRIADYDIMSHYLALVPNYSLKNAKFWLPFSFNYYDKGSDKYYTGFLLTPTILHMINQNVGVEFGARFNRKYYWTPLTFSQDDRSAKNLGGSLGLYYFIKKQQGFFLARFSYEHDFATGTNWDCSTYRLLLSTLYPVTNKFRFNLFFDMYLQPYDHNFYDGDPLVVNPKRHDSVLMFGAQAIYEIVNGLEFNVHYYMIRDNSNVALYDYDRHIIGCQLGYRY